MTENKRFHTSFNYCCGDTGVIDELENEWFIENIYSIPDFEENWDTVIDKLNQVVEENEQLKETINKIKESIEYLKDKVGDVTLADVDGTLNKIDEILNGDR